jgi:lipopolysaccharide biosynthesis glycosyltransferase
MLGLSQRKYFVRSVMKDKGMKWVIVADVMVAIVVALLVWASLLDKKAERESARAVAQSAYDHPLPIAPEDCSNVKGTVDAVLITDANYMDFTRVAIQSAKQTKCAESVYNFYVMTLDVSEADKKALEALAEDKVSVTVLPQKEIDLFYIRETHVSKTALLKYYIADVLPDLDKVLYFDSDVMVLHDLNTLFQTDVADVYLAAVKDPSWFFENGHVLELNLEKRGFYFNSGVMLMNLKKIREEGLREKLEDYTNNNFRTYMDQDALNVVVEDKVKLLPFKDNTMNFFFEYVALDTLAQFYGENWKTYEDVFSPAVIIHFASSKKPMGPLAPKKTFFRMLQERWYLFYNPLPPLE